jgi:hypothetical protein
MLEKERHGLFPIVSFRTEAGQELRFQSNIGSYPPKYRVGQQVDVVYRVARPDRARIRTALGIPSAALWLLIFAAFFLCVGVVMIHFARRASRMPRQ